MHVYVMHIECAKGAFQLDRKKCLIYRYTHDCYSLHAFAACMREAALSLQKHVTPRFLYTSMMPIRDVTNINILAGTDKAIIMFMLKLKTDIADIKFVYYFV